MVDKQIELLGYQARDRVTGFTGVVSSICFDLFGCVQALVTPPVDEKGNCSDSRWFDVARLITSGDRVMEPPAHFTEDRGPAEKPARTGR